MASNSKQRKSEGEGDCGDIWDHEEEGSSRTYLEASRMYLAVETSSE